MVMIKWPECKYDVSDKTKVCPFCSYPIEDLNLSGTINTFQEQC